MEIIKEKGKVFLRGILTESNTKNKKSILGRDYKNRNGRTYPNEILEPAFKELIKEVLDNGFVYSYLNHPNTKELIEKDSCAKIVEATWDEKTMRGFGKFEVLENTKDGKKLLKMISEGTPIGNSTRGIGELNENKEVTKLSIVTSDIIPIKGNSKQSCRSCTLSLTENLTEAVNEESTFESLYFDDYLLEQDSESDCGCYLDLDEDQQKVVQLNLVNKLKSVIDSF